MVQYLSIKEIQELPPVLIDEYLLLTLKSNKFKVEPETVRFEATQRYVPVRSYDDDIEEDDDNQVKELKGFSGVKNWLKNIWKELNRPDPVNNNFYAVLRVINIKVTVNDKSELGKTLHHYIGVVLNSLYDSTPLMKSDYSFDFSIQKQDTTCEFEGCFVTEMQQHLNDLTTFALSFDLYRDPDKWFLSHDPLHN